MKHLVVLLAAAALFLGSCGQQEVGEMQRQSESVDLDNAQSAPKNTLFGGYAGLLHEPSC